MSVIDVRIVDGDGCIFNSKMMQRLAEYEARIAVAREVVQGAITTALSEEADRPRMEAWPALERGNMPWPALESGNMPFFDHLREDTRSVNGEQLILLCDSNRLSNSIDVQNGYINKTGSFFPVLLTIADFLKSIHPCADLDMLLLADIFCKIEPGSAFRKALELGNSTTASHPGCPLEHSKILWIYVISHYLATKYPNDEIKCSFYDDKESILQNLNFWMTNSDLIPERVSFALFHYFGEEVTCKYFYEGTNPNVDRQYEETARILAYMGNTNTMFDWNNNRVQELKLEPELITADKIAEVRERWSSIQDAANTQAQPGSDKQSSQPSLPRTKVRGLKVGGFWGFTNESATPTAACPNSGQDDSHREGFSAQ